MSAPILAVPPISSPYVVVENFLRPDVARTLRKDTDLHFGNSSTVGASEIWGYRRVPHGHVCLHTISDKVISRFKIEMFVGALRNWATKSFGFGTVTHPSLSVSSGGGGEALHGEPRNGRFGYVYFLTNPHEGSLGGNILVTSGLDDSRNAVEARFNRLLIFDDRVVRTMEYGEGSLDPLAGRLVLQGYVEEQGPIVTGALPFSELQPKIVQAMEQFILRHGEEASRYHGPVTVRFVIDADGHVSDICLLLDRVLGVSDGDPRDWHELQPKFLSAFKDIRFPPANGTTTVVFPMVLTSD